MSQSERPFSVGSEKELKPNPPRSPKKESVEKKNDNEKLKVSI
jgi:hypothetical protein